MTIGRILGGALLATVLLTAGCGLLFSPDVQPKSAEEHIQNAIDGLTNARSVKEIKSEVTQGIEKLPKADGDAALKVEEVRQTLTSVQSRLTQEEIKKDKQSLINDLEAASQKLAAIPKADPRPEGPWPWRQWLVYAGEVLGALVVVLLLGIALRYVWKRAWNNVQINVARIVVGHLGSERKAQPDFTDKFSAFSAAQKETNSNLLDLQTEVRTLARMVRDSLADRNDRRPAALSLSYPPQLDGPTQKQEPEFPVSVNEYLGKMSRFANSVKLDFQNGILVNDPENKDELFLIRDSRQPDEPLFLVPGAAQFHNKQDFEIYYAKYYECVKPAMGEVWIIGPAVVSKVPGGWQLREKGMLEVR